MKRQAITPYTSTPSLLSNRNRRSPISRLPADVLLNIFFTVRDIVMDATWPNLLPVDWIAVTHVCSLWRNTALDCRNLWARVEYKTTLFPKSREVGKLNKFRTFLERSAQAKISVRLNAPDSHLESILDLLRGHMWRVHASHIMFMQTNARRRFDSLESRLSEMTQHAKSLTLFHFAVNSPQMLNLRNIYPENIKLDYLSLTSVIIPWRSSIFNNLISLKLVLILRTPGLPTLTLPDLANILKSCPKLQSLDLRSVSITANSFSQEIESDTLNLPYLEHIVVRGVEFSVCKALFDLLTYSENATLELEFDDYPLRSPEPLHPKMLNPHPKDRYKTIDITLDETYVRFTIEPEDDQDGEFNEDSALSPLTVILSTEAWTNPSSISRTIAFLLGDPFWTFAHEIVITFDSNGDEDPDGDEDSDGDRTPPRHYLNASLWEILLTGIPNSIGQLIIKFAPNPEYSPQRESIIGLLDALSSSHHRGESSIEGGTTLPNLREVDVTIYCEKFTAEDVEERHEALFEQSQNIVYAGRTWRVCFPDEEELRDFIHSC